jgi:hypothetical protein
MNATVEDLRPTIVPKSDQLNAEQLLGTSMAITVTRVDVSASPEQPVTIHYEGENGRPFKPCKTMRKLLVFAWGENGNHWAGRSMQLFCDPSVKFGGDEVGGIRISHLSHIDKALKVSLTATRGKKTLYTVARLELQREAEIVELIEDMAGAPTVDALKDNFAAAYRAHKDAPTRARLKAAYDSRLAELTKTTTKTLADYRAQIDNATSSETAALAIDEARDVLLPTEMEELQKTFTMAWTD